jgi:hypothetical protein
MAWVRPRCYWITAHYRNSQWEERRGLRDGFVQSYLFSKKGRCQLSCTTRAVLADCEEPVPRSATQ